MVVDGLLPDANGIVWIEELRQAGYRTPIIFVSAFYRDLATFKHLTHDLDVIKVFHKPVVIDRVRPGGCDSDLRTNKPNACRASSKRRG